MLCHWHSTPLSKTRRERAEHLRKDKQDFFDQYGPKAKAILEELLTRYAEHAMAQFVLPDALEDSPISGHGNLMEIASFFGDEPNCSRRLIGSEPSSTRRDGINLERRRMSVYQFFSVLPAILAVLGFVAFSLLRGKILDDQVVRDIVSKLRTQGTIDPAVYGSMTPTKLKATIDADKLLRAAVDQGDLELLKQTLRQQFAIRVIVYAVLAAIFCFGVGMYVYQTTRPKKLTLSGIRIASTVPTAKDLAVDTDPLEVTWTADGPAEDIRVSLENVRTSKKTSPLRISSVEGRVVFPAASYRDLLEDRRPGQQNPLRVLIQSGEQMFSSQEVEVLVGVTIMVAASPDKLVVASLVDNRLTQNHDFEAELILPRHRLDAKSASLKAKVVGGKGDFVIDRPSTVNWPMATLIYTGPYDPRVVRKEFLVDDALEAASDGRE